MRSLLALLLAFTLPLVASDAQWEGLKSLRSGEKIWVHYTQNYKSHSAKAEASDWTADGLTVRIKHSAVVLARGDVRKVAVYGGRSRGKGAGIGALIGAGVGAVLFGGTAAAASPGDFDMVPVGAFVAGGILFSAGVGALIGVGLGSTKKTTVYEAPGK
jgi:hypothetical protein